MKNFTLEVTGSDASEVDAAGSKLIEELASDQINLSAAHSSGQRDAGIIATVVSLVGGAAAVAQIVTTVHGILQKKDVRVIIVHKEGSRTTLDQYSEPEDIQKTIEAAVKESEE